METLTELSDLIEMAAGGEPPNRYRVRFRCRTLAQDSPTRSPKVVNRSICDIYLHREYPRKPPMVIWRSPIFHPNILPPDRGGTVCFGGWSPGETLADLVLRIGEMIQYKNYDLADALNMKAVRWVRKYQERFPVDDRPLAPQY
jgi:hypothetical protein